MRSAWSGIKLWPAVPHVLEHACIRTCMVIWSAALWICVERPQPWETASFVRLDTPAEGPLHHIHFNVIEHVTKDQLSWETTSAWSVWPMRRLSRRVLLSIAYGSSIPICQTKYMTMMTQSLHLKLCSSSEHKHRHIPVHMYDIQKVQIKTFTGQCCER